jgi:hypothetical protein
MDDSASQPPSVFHRALSGSDWGVLLVYLVAVVSIGFYFSRRQLSKREYLLRASRMPPFLVGISLVATLLSTVTFLGAPGEMIQHGPAFAVGVLAMPFWLVVVAIVWIPFFMRYRFTSIYEYAELRFSRTSRLCSASLFVMMRLGWMAVGLATALSLSFARDFGYMDLESFNFIDHADFRTGDHRQRSDKRRFPAKADGVPSHWEYLVNAPTTTHSPSEVDRIIATTATD